MKSNSSVIIFGGRVDHPGSQIYQCFNDLHFLNLATMSWARVPVSGIIPDERAAHCASVLGSNLIVFGGVSQGKYTRAKCHILETNADTVERMNEEDVK